jgi:arylsulfatase A-like enzyme
VELPYPVTFNDDYSGRELTAGNTMMTIENHLTRKDLKMQPPPGLTGQDLHKWERTGDKGEYVSPSDTLTGMALKKWKYQKYMKDYLACVRSVDDNIGRLLDYLDETGLAENTIVIYTADQGFYLGDHGWYDKRFMYEESLRMPFLIRYPGTIQAGQRIEQMTLNVDFAPTLLRMAGVEVPEEMQGESFAPLFTDQEDIPWREAIYYHYYEYPKWHQVQPHYGIRTDRYKLIHFYYDVDVWELYDLKEDPHELNNLYGQPEFGEMIVSLKEQLKLLQRKYGDDIPLEKMREITERGMVKY